ncbi:MAG: MarR family transcriptional regulator [Spirochaetes bacterium]|nr:MarR family transcriptional regulator [Spirochaetota bacterium]
MKNKTSADKNENKLAVLSEQINKISKEVPIASVIAIITTDEVIADYLHREWERNESTRAGFRILNILTKNGGFMRFTDMSKKVFRSKCAVSRVVDNLEKTGLVKREMVNDDRREKRIIITKKGIEHIEETMLQRRQISKHIMSCLNEKEMETLISLLKRIRKHIQEKYPPK